MQLDCLAADRIPRQV